MKCAIIACCESATCATPAIAAAGCQSTKGVAITSWSVCEKDTRSSGVVTGPTAVCALMATAILRVLELENSGPCCRKVTHTAAVAQRRRPAGPIAACLQLGPTIFVGRCPGSTSKFGSSCNHAPFEPMGSGLPRPTNQIGSSCR